MGEGAAQNPSSIEVQSSIEALYRTYRQALWRFLARKRLTRDEVADIVQETYCRIQQSTDPQTIRHPKAFLFRVADNIRLNVRKRQRHGIDHDTDDIGTLEIATEEPGPYRSIKAQQELAIVRAALQELPPTCRDVFVMNRFDNLSYSQIAGELGLSVSMIEKHVSHAITHMRKRLAATRPLRKAPLQALK